VERYRCPRCGEGTIGFWQKQFAGAALRAGCSACGARLAVPAGRSILVAAVAVVVPMLAAILVYAAWLQYAAPTGREIWRIYAALLVGLLFGGGLAVWARHRFVPLIFLDDKAVAGEGPPYGATLEHQD